MKYAITLIIIAALVTGVWYGAGNYRRKQMLSSGRVLLLVNSSAKSYSYSDLMEADDITSAFKIVGYADELSAAQIADATTGLQLVVGVQPQPGDSRVLALRSTSPIVPTTTEQKAWVAALARLPKAVQDLCAQLTESSYVQPCLADHLIFAYVKEGAPVTACASLYVPNQKDFCESAVGKKDVTAYSDANNNGMIDGFESLKAMDQGQNTYNLPEINPAE